MGTTIGIILTGFCAISFLKLFCKKHEDSIYAAKRASKFAEREKAKRSGI